MRISLRSLLVALVFASGLALSAADDAVFVVNPAGPDSLSADAVKSILLGNKTKWDAGGIIKLAVLATGPAHEAVMQQYASRSADQFEKYWKKQVFTGKGVAPDMFKTDSDLLAFVAKTPGAFGYVSAGAETTGVKVIKIE